MDCYILIVPIEIINIIIEDVGVKYSIYFTATCKFFFNNVNIYNLWEENVTRAHQNKKNITLLKQKRFQNVMSLNMQYCDIGNIAYLSNLTKLNINMARDYFNQNSITKLSKLKYLTMNSNYCVTNISHLTSLVYLEACDSALKDIYNLNNLTYLRLRTNDYINDISHLTLLTYLDTNISLKNINNLNNLHTLKITYDICLDDIKYLRNLTDLQIINSSIDQSNFEKITNLKKLKIRATPNIHYIGHLTNLTYLDISCPYATVKIGQDSLSILSNLHTLIITFNSQIIDISHMTRLTCLDIRYTPGITQNSINCLVNLTDLKIHSVANILNISQLSALTCLQINKFMYNINQNGIKILTNLINLNILE